MKKQTSVKRRNLYFRNPDLFDALQMAIEKNLISARSGSARVEQLIASDIRRLAPRMRAAGVEIPASVFTK